MPRSQTDDLSVDLTMTVSYRGKREGTVDWATSGDL